MSVLSKLLAALRLVPLRGPMARPAGPAPGSLTMLVNVIIRDACQSGASQVIVEHAEDRGSVQFKINGGLAAALVLSGYVAKAIIRRLKTMARLEPSNRWTPQRGQLRFTMKFERRSAHVTYAVSSRPTRSGEQVSLQQTFASGKEILMAALRESATRSHTPDTRTRHQARIVPLGLTRFRRRLGYAA